MWAKLAALFMGDGGIIGKVLDKCLVDATKKAELAAAFAQEFMAQSAALDMAAADIIKAEATSGGWLTRSWRPIVMLVFTSLIVARWFGWSAPGLSEAEALELWAIIKIGLGGYVIGRSAEKVAPSIADAVKGVMGK